MRHKILIAPSMLLTMLSIGCTTLTKIAYHPDINQGNYLTSIEIKKIQKGMTQQQVAYILGNPILKDPFGAQVWFYIFRRERGHARITQNTLILTFTSDGILTDIQNKSGLSNED